MTSPSSTAPDADLARLVCDHWLSAVNARDVDGLLALYAEDSVLLPTFSPHIIRDEALRREYFTRLAERPGLSVSLHERTFTAQAVGDSFVASGVYCFQMDFDGEPYSFEARFTFVIQPHSSRPIVHHHSSQIPRNLG